MPWPHLGKPGRHIINIAEDLDKCAHKVKHGQLDWELKYLWNNDKNHHAGISWALDYCDRDMIHQECSVCVLSSHRIWYLLHMNLEPLHGVIVSMKAVIEAMWVDPVSCLNETCISHFLKMVGKVWWGEARWTAQTMVFQSEEGLDCGRNRGGEDNYAQ